MGADSEDKVCPACKGKGFGFWAMGRNAGPHLIDCLFCMGSGVSREKGMEQPEDRLYKRNKAGPDSGKA